MTKKETTDYDFKKIESDIKENTIGNFYIFHGVEHYLRDHSLEQLRRHLCPDGLDGFNYKRFEGKELSMQDLEEAIDILPVFAERTFIEIHDFDLFSKKTESTQLLSILSNLPDYVCILFVFNTLEFKPDKRTKNHKEILTRAQVIEFAVQHQSDLLKWISNHYRRLGKSISRSDAEYLIHITGGYMATLKNEIEKTAAHSKSNSITRTDIDAVVIPILDAVVYQLSDAIIKKEHVKAMRILDDLFHMREAPQRLIYSISLKMRQLLTARICLDENRDNKYLMEICSIRYDFQAKMLLDTARKSSLQNCCQAVIDCAVAAFDLNSTPDPESRMVELITKLANR